MDAWLPARPGELKALANPPDDASNGSTKDQAAASGRTARGELSTLRKPRH